MAYKQTPKAWKHAIKVVKSYAVRFPSMETKVFHPLHLSYDSLPSDTVRSCFLYCFLYPEDSFIPIEDLINKWIGEGFLNEWDDNEDGAENQGYDIIDTLLQACLLEKVSSDTVKMHDVIREMALWIGREYEKQTDKFLVRAGLLKKQYAANLKSKGVFEEVAQRLPSPLATVRPSEGIIMGMKNNLCEIWGHLEKEDVGIIGLYGLGGVGKTTLLTEVNNKFVNTTHDFDVVIWVTVSSNLDLDQVQDDIGKKMGLYDEIWKNKRPEGNKEDICGVLSKKKFVLLLDDMWERLDLLEVGIPLQNKQNSKIVFTTRSKRVCGQMDAHKTIEVECLPWGEAWDLFQKKVGETTLKSDPDIL
ncbi:unnamed protein product [Ilex paraguariensis]|uniref:NB-ARC domain-containing protein n=1 Tax=Ilex paraguariensis TaxID=185542 RepID=A0ABC8S8L0_9AQUA